MQMRSWKNLESQVLCILSIRQMQTEDIQKAGSVVLEGTDVADAEGGAYQDSSTSSQKYAVSLTLTKNGKTKFAEATKANVGKQIAIVYDDQVLSAPNVNEEISGGKARITG